MDTTDSGLTAVLGPELAALTLRAAHPRGQAPSQFVREAVLRDLQRAYAPCFALSPEATAGAMAALALALDALDAG
jgi:hypothetical protein